MVISPDGGLVYQRKRSCAALSKGGSGDVFAGSIAGIYLILEEEAKRKAKADLSQTAFSLGALMEKNPGTPTKSTRRRNDWGGRKNSR